MRELTVALIYPPPWKIKLPDDPAGYGDEGPPSEFREGDLDADFFQIPWGLLSLGAGAKRAGYRVKVYNLSSFAWPKVEETMRALRPDVVGLSAWTANRRGVGFVAKLVKSARPDATVVVGGPHATPLAKEMLLHHPAIDVVSTGESDVTFLELLDRRSRGLPFEGLAGAWTRRADGSPVQGPKRENIEDLDVLASPHDYFATHIAMTSRGCPWSCTFCGAETSWGRGFRANSVGYVLDAFESALGKLPVKMIQIKDDTFTTNKKRVHELCEEIGRRKLDFFWSCDTRVDLLTDGLLRAMRLAGCQRLSLGVESGSQRILDLIEKKITVDEILASTALAKKYGIKVRYFMMLGNRGETRESFDETLAFLERARPHEYIFSCLSIYPGTKDFADAEKSWLDRSVYFTNTFQELKTPFDADEALTRHLDAWFAQHSGLQTMHRDGVAEYEEILVRLGDYHAAHMDLAVALYESGDLDRAEHHVRRAMELGYPCPGLAENHLACFAKARGDVQGMMDHFTRAATIDPQHFVLIRNVNRAREWFKADGPAKGLPLTLDVRHDFQLLERTQQPTLPGPLPEDYAAWGDVPEVAVEGDGFVKTPEQEGSRAGLKPRTKLPVVG